MFSLRATNRAILPVLWRTPKQRSDLEDRDTGRVLWIVGSTDRHLIPLFHPSINARFSWLLTGVGRLPRAVIVAHASRAISFVQPRPKPRGGSIA
jgi:hypothetical protein